MASKLTKDYPSLRAAGPTIAKALAKQGHLIPILDGLDELPVTSQTKVIDALNRSLTKTDQLVLTSRTKEYTAAITEAGTVLTAAAVLELKPLTSAQAANYLTKCLTENLNPTWADLLHRLRTDTAGHLATLLDTPLTLWLLRTVYVTPKRDPTPLLELESGASPDAKTLQDGLFDELIPTVLTTRPPTRNRRDPDDPFRPRHTWNPEDVQRWLTYLAKHLQDTNNQNLHWWHLARSTVTVSKIKLLVGLLIGLGFGPAAGLMYGLAFGLPGALGGLTFGLALGLTFALMFEPTAQLWLDDEPAYANLQVKKRVALLTSSLGAGLKVALAIGLTVGLIIGLVVGLADNLTAGLSAGLIAGLIAGLAFGLAGGLMVGLMQWVGEQNDTHSASGPRSTYTATRTLTVLQLCLALLTIWLAGGLAAWLAGKLMSGVGLPLGLAVGLVGGLIAGLAGGKAARVRSKLVIRSGAWLSYLLAICSLAKPRKKSGKLPLRLMGFLDDAYRLGLLRAVGPAYQFRHAEFQKHLVPDRLHPDDH